ncbi:MAG: hypothetical protein GXP63_06770 [DPANN group archaeon]|nr:hypothetical protein [DPANN group archaeon]
MLFGMFRKTDPICGMKEEKGKGIHKDGNWFCNQTCIEEFEKTKRKTAKHGGCCCH